MTNAISVVTPTTDVTDDQAAPRHFLTKLKVATSRLSIALLLVLSISSAKGACLHWEQHVNRANDSASYEGSLGNRRVRMMLHLDVATGFFEGAYGYSDQQGVLTLSGYMLPDGAGADLEEQNEQGRVTGLLSLAFFQPHTEPQSSWGNDWDFYQKHIRSTPSKCYYLTGVWQPHPWDGKPGQLVTLHEAGPDIDPANNTPRLKNEATAYQFLQAALHNKRKMVASLLHYPFYSYDNSRKGQVTKTWPNPKSVLDNYDKIVHLSEYQRSAVPHILFTNNGVTEFMNRSVYLYKGKITWICAGACPAMPLNEMMGNLTGSTDKLDHL